jgi:hypothetical protein
MFCNMLSLTLTLTVSQILEKNWVFVGAVHGLCIGFKNVDHSVRKEICVMYLLSLTSIGSSDVNKKEFK